MKHELFLSGIYNYVKEHPDAAAFIQNHVADAIDASRKEALHRAADMEALLIIALSRRTKSQSQFIIDNLKKWDGKTAFSWESKLEELESMINKV